MRIYPCIISVLKNLPVRLEYLKTMSIDSETELKIIYNKSISSQYISTGIVFKLDL